MTSDAREQAIRELAYAKWEKAGWPAGDGINFWLEAEAELPDSDPSEQHAEASLKRDSINSAFAPADPPPLKIPKVAGQSRKKAG